MERYRQPETTTLAAKLKLIERLVPKLHGNTWLDCLKEDLRSEAILAFLEGRDPKSAVDAYLEHEAENCPASCTKH
jgi:hypothetical protein